MLIGGKLEMVRQAAKRFIYAISEGYFNSPLDLKLVDRESKKNIILSIFL